jgi:hypothetical protein
MRRGCQLQLFGDPKGPIRDNLEGAQDDAIRLKLGRFDGDGRFYLDAGATFVWRPVQSDALSSARPVAFPGVAASLRQAERRQRAR